MTDRDQIYRDTLGAEETFMAELTKRFGKNAGTARYEERGRGELGSPLRAAYEAFVAANARYDAVLWGTAGV